MTVVDAEQIMQALLLPVTSWLLDTSISDLSHLPDFVWCLVALGRFPILPVRSSYRPALRSKSKSCGAELCVGDVAWRMCLGLARLVGGRCVARILSEVNNPIWSDILFYSSSRR